MLMRTVIEETCWSKEEKDLFRAVVRQVGSWSIIWDRTKDFRDASWGASGFIYYSETEKFAKKHIENILYCLNEFEQDLGVPLKKNQDNLLNWYAWFALEHIIDRIMMYKESKNV